MSAKRLLANTSYQNTDSVSGPVSESAKMYSVADSGRNHRQLPPSTSTLHPWLVEAVAIIVPIQGHTRQIHICRQRMHY